MQAEGRAKGITSRGEVVDEIGSREPLPKDGEERLLTAKRLIAEQCIYGVDLNPLAVELAKLSIWLITLAKGRPFGFLDHNLRCGDSLLGITSLEQLHSLELNPAPHALKKLFAGDIDSAVNEAIRLRLDLRAKPINDIRDVEAMADLDECARSQLELPSLAADALVGEYLAAGGGACDTTMLSVEVGEALKAEPSSVDRLRKRGISGLNTDLPSKRAFRLPFHWPLEFPEVFLRDQDGFDAIVGNPPFLGGQRITGAMGTAYRDFLVGSVAKGVRGSADLVAYFFLRAFDLLRSGGCFGLLAVNTIAEGDTRQVGLERLLTELGATIYAAFPNERWPGKAAVVTSRIHICKMPWKGKFLLGQREVQQISAFLSELEEWTPKPLKENSDKSFQGSIVNGMGFIITERAAFRLIEDDQKNVDVLFPFLNGKDLNSHPNQEPSRWIINFWDWPEEIARQYQEPYRIIFETVKSERQSRIPNEEDSRVQRWWQYERSRPALYHAIGRGQRFIDHPQGYRLDAEIMPRVLVCSEVTKHLAFALVTNRPIFSANLDVFAMDDGTDFAILQSSIHEIWARKYSSKLETRLKYSPGNAFETFPMIPAGKTIELKAIGDNYHSLRSETMRENDIGLTSFYNLFHKPDENNPLIDRLRLLHREIDEKVTEAYGWSDINLEHDFYHVPYLPENDRLRFTISESARLQILRRLAILNRNRYEEEQAADARLSLTPTERMQSKPKQKASNKDGGSLLDQNSRHNNYKAKA